MIQIFKNIRNNYLFLQRKRKQDKKFHALIGRYIVSDEEANNAIYQKIIENKPCFISRFGSTELSTLLYYKQERLNGHQWQAYYQVLCEVSGFFPFTEEAMDRFSAQYFSFINNIDMLGIWKIGEENLSERFNQNIHLINLVALEPYYFEKPWSRALAGKKVLVIHPFAQSILQQYARRHLLFPERNVLPEFDLQVIQAVQSLADNTGGFSSWFEALDHMCTQVAKADFDVAIIGAGAYGMPLANFVKMKMGKVAIHLGGATQILFGIKGKRWDTIPRVQGLFNEYWINPSLDERPAGAEKVEGGTYW